MNLRTWQGASLLLLAVASLGDNCDGQPTYPPRFLREGAPPAGPCAASLEWDAPLPAPPNGVFQYAIYRDNVELARQPASDRTYEDPTWLEANDSYRYSVWVIDGNLAFKGGLGAYFDPVACPPPLPDISLETRVFLVKFSDFLQEPRSPAEVQDILVDSNESLTAWWEANSYGRQTLDIGLLPIWIQLGVPIAGYCNDQNPETGLWTGCNTGAMLADTIGALDPLVFFGGIDRILVFFSGMAVPGIAGSVDTDEGQIPAAALSAQAALDLGGRKTVAHELGHLSGLPHAKVIDCPNGEFPPNPFLLTSGGCTTPGLEASTDPMGMAGTLFEEHFSAFYKERLGFLDSSRIQTVPATSEGVVVRLYNLQEDIDATQMIKIPTTAPAASSASWYFIEYRRVSLIFGGAAVIVRLKPGVGRETFHGVNLHQNALPFVDTVQGIRIDPISTGGDSTGLFVDVRIDKP